MGVSRVSELGEGPSAQLKPQIDQLVVRCLTTSESGLCMIFDFLDSVGRVKQKREVETKGRKEEAGKRKR